MDEKIADLHVNEMHGETLEKEVRILAQKIRRIRTSDTPAFIMGYCAARDDIFEEVVEYIRQQLDISEQSTWIVHLEPSMFNLRDYFLNYKDELQSNLGDVLLVKVKGFEGLDALKTDLGYRVAHDYDQDVCEGQKERYSGLTKKVVVITHIGHSAGSNGYAAALRSAAMSQFKSFLYEFNPETKNAKV